MEIILDTNFIIECVKNKIDLFESLKELFGVYTLIVPIQLYSELEKISNDRKITLREREYALVSIELLKKYKTKSIDIKTPDVDSGIFTYIKKNSQIVTATLDKNLKKKISSNKNAKFLLIKQKKYLVLE
ncbi:MAG: hypothetical protein AABX03_00110, partial [Nanoarchaeota archaeon]